MILLDITKSPFIRIQQSQRNHICSKLLDDQTENRVQLLFLKFLKVESLWSFLEKVIAVDAARNANVLPLDAVNGSLSLTLILSHQIKIFSQGFWLLCHTLGHAELVINQHFFMTFFTELLSNQALYGSQKL